MEENEAKFNAEARAAGGGGERTGKSLWSPIKGANRLSMSVAKDGKARRRSSIAEALPSRRNSTCVPSGGARRASCGGVSLCSGGAAGLALGGTLTLTLTLTPSADPHPHPNPNPNPKAAHGVPVYLYQFSQPLSSDPGYHSP